VLIDSAWPHRGQLIKAAAEQLFGPRASPAAILLTHIHPDHSGSALELARMWDLPVYVHPDELVLAPGGYMPEYANPLDRWLVAPLLRLLPRRMVEESRSRNTLEGTALAFDPAADIPGLPDWQAVPTPGHTPGHVAFFRPADRVLITGDAVLTVNVNSPRDLLAGKQRASAPPYISTWNWPAARQSVEELAGLAPDVLACGHGRPMAGPEAAAGLSALVFSMRTWRRASTAGRSRPTRCCSSWTATRPRRRGNG
jgi:glyoxylase-like metal-dependent hydrolase (beta-lactamase superfamily II)